MATTTYCLRADVESVLSAHAVDRMVDDDMDGAVEADEEAHVTTAIARAASRNNSRVQKRYKLADLSGNDWMTFVNASIAAQTLSRRRGNGVPPSLQEEVDEYLSDLDDIRADRIDIPEQASSFDYAPAVSNFEVQRGFGLAPVRVSTQLSTGADPDSSLRRYIAFQRRHCH